MPEMDDPWKYCVILPPQVFSVAQNCAPNSFSVGDLPLSAGTAHGDSPNPLRHLVLNICPKPLRYPVSL